jgi:predicted phage terminase large subunit-like protein
MQEILAKKASQPRPIWAALYEGDPCIEGGNYINTGNFQYATEDEIPINQRFARFWDIATDIKLSNDETAGVRGFIQGDIKKPDGRFWITDMRVGRWKWPDARGQIVNLGRTEKTILGFEDNGGFATARDNLQEVAPDLYIRGVTVIKDKLTRALDWITAVNEKKVILVRGAWNSPFLQECESFPMPGEPDNRIDGVSGLFHMLRNAAGFPTTVQRERTVERRHEKFPRKGRIGF